MKKIEQNIPVVRHLDDVDDLLKFGRDSELVPGQELEAGEIAGDILEEARKEGKKAIIFVCSDKKRAVQTAELVASHIKNVDEKMKLRVVKEGRLSSIDQGEIILPPDYKAGDHFEGLPLANKIFNKEVFSDEIANDLYRFGDPIKLEDGSYKYPELATYFRGYGENNKELMARIYELIIETSEKIDKLNERTKVVVITHSQLYQIFRNMRSVAQKIKNNELEFHTGELPRLCWKVYKEKSKDNQPTYKDYFIPIEDLCDPKIVELLKKELEYLTNLK